MTLFLTLTTSLTLLAALFLLWPLLRQSPTVAGESRARRDLNRQIYTERLQQIEQEQQGGRLSAEQAQLLKEEAGQHLVGDVAQLQDEDKPVASRLRWPVVLLVVLALPVLSVAMYLQSDSWMLIGASKDKPAWTYLTHRLEERIEATPTDSEALLMLARTQRAQGDTAAAIETYAQLNQITGFAVAEYLADEAETRVLAEQGAFSDIARQRLQQALEANPNDGRALWYAGLAAGAAGNTAQARDYWLRLNQQKGLPQSFRKVLNQQLVQMGVSAEQLQEPAATIKGPELQLTIQASPELVKDLPADTPVFVMARPVDGTRAMLAVRKHRLGELPLQTVLTDGMNMAGGPQLSDYQDYHIVARVAVSGNALPQSGDPFAQIEVNRTTAMQGVTLTVDQRWP